MVKVDDREVELEITKTPTMVGAYDPVQDVIFIGHKLLDNPNLYLEVLNHEILHAKHPKGILIHTWIDITSWIKRSWKTRKAINKLLPYQKYWRTIIANTVLMLWFGLITVGPIWLIIKLIEFYS